MTITRENRFQITHADRAIWPYGFVVFDVTGETNSEWAATQTEAKTIREYKKAVALVVADQREDGDLSAGWSDDQLITWVRNNINSDGLHEYEDTYGVELTAAYQMVIKGGVNNVKKGR